MTYIYYMHEEIIRVKAKFTGSEDELYVNGITYDLLLGCEQGTSIKVISIYGAGERTYPHLIDMFEEWNTLEKLQQTEEDEKD